MKKRAFHANAECLVAGSTLLATAGQLSIKLGLGRQPSVWTRMPSLLPNPCTIGVLTGLFVYGLGTLLWISAISRREVSYLYPLASLNYIFVAICGHLVLNEPLLPGRWIGIGIMTAGIVLLTWASPKSPAGASS